MSIVEINSRSENEKDSSPQWLREFSLSKVKIIYHLSQSIFNRTKFVEMTGKVKSSDWRDLRRKKSEDIKRSLVHRARLRKKYFKILQQEEEQTDGRPETASNEVTINVPHADIKQEKRDEFGEDSSSYNSKASDRTSYQERLQIAKERKVQKRSQKIEQTKLQLDQIKQKKLRRESRKERFSKKTRTGQPMMGPRINNLLEKIRNDQEAE